MQIRQHCLTLTLATYRVSDCPHHAPSSGGGSLTEREKLGAATVNHKLLYHQDLVENRAGDKFLQISGGRWREFPFLLLSPRKFWLLPVLTLNLNRVSAYQLERNN